jgi:hypothetical protein
VVVGMTLLNRLCPTVIVGIPMLNRFRSHSDSWHVAVNCNVKNTLHDMSVDDLDVHDMDMLNMVMHNVRARREHAECWRSCHWHHKAILSSAINKMTTLKRPVFPITLYITEEFNADD